MNVLDVILAVEQGEVEDEDALIDGLSEHREHVPADCPAPWDHWRDGHWCNLAGEMN